jgi:hypothetical protein
MIAKSIQKIFRVSLPHFERTLFVACASAGVARTYPSFWKEFDLNLDFATQLVIRSEASQ